MDHEKKRVLDMLADGTVTADEAMMLLEQLEKPVQPEARNMAAAPDRTEEKMLRVRVIVSEDNAVQPTNIEVNLPLRAARIAGKIISTAMPEQAWDALREERVDLSSIDFAELIDALAETGGDIINISHQDDHDHVTVRVYVG